MNRRVPLFAVLALLAAPGATEDDAIRAAPPVTDAGPERRPHQGARPVADALPAAAPAAKDDSGLRRTPTERPSRDSVPAAAPGPAADEEKTGLKKKRAPSLRPRAGGASR